MDIAYLSEFVDDVLVFRRVSASGIGGRITVGDSIPLDQVYCPRIIAGRLPKFTSDTEAIPFVKKIAPTEQLPIRSYINIPIQRLNGSVYGMFCCLSARAKPSLNKHDHGVMLGFAYISSEVINGKLAETKDSDEIRNRVQNTILDRSFSLVYQPIMDADSSAIRGFEALCRFKGSPIFHQISGS